MRWCWKSNKVWVFKLFSSKSSWHTRYIFFFISIVPAANNNSVDDFAKSTVVSSRWYARSFYSLFLFITHSRNEKRRSIFLLFLLFLSWVWRVTLMKENIWENISKTKINKHQWVHQMHVWEEQVIIKIDISRMWDCSWWQERKKKFYISK